MDEKGEKEENSKPSSTTENFVAFSDEISNMSFPFSPAFSSIFDMMSPLPPSLCDDPEFSDFGGFMDMLSLPDYTWHQNIVTTSAPPPPEITQPLQSLPSPNAPNSFEVVNTSLSPNSLPILSPPNEVTDKATENKNETKDETMNSDKGGENNDQDKIKNQLKPKKRNQKKKESRVAFMTRSEVDHLEDGYRWRKYGQKDLKNSAHPRSYYRCTFPNCGVKKRVERSTEDPSVVMTTYEGTHTHPSTVPLPPKVGLVQKASGSGGPSGVASANYALRQQHSQRQQELEQQALAAAALYNSTSTSPLNVVNASSCINFGNMNISSITGFLNNQENRQAFVPSRVVNPPPHALLRDNGGLLQDIIMPYRS
ncbi:probable WRKY transcription factor 48 [Cajanus cajan]|uniref:WRKY transcription factor 23 n=1 Tax=Cajanus cajan TaxID=3821 RepID=A0A151SCW3_CAJCA|nr:probable WRKY transcription factor 48 [Cajanus cajan]KYP52617.1 putative WRKY transcription factor 23 [Cajanus cajan]